MNEEGKTSSLWKTEVSVRSFFLIQNGIVYLKVCHLKVPNPKSPLCKNEMSEAVEFENVKNKIGNKGASLSNKELQLNESKQKRRTGLV